MATKCAINGRQWGAYDGRRHAGEPTASLAAAAQTVKVHVDSSATLLPPTGPDTSFSTTTVLAPEEKMMPRLAYTAAGTLAACSSPLPHH